MSVNKARCSGVIFRHALRFTNKPESFQMMSSWCQLKSQVTSYTLLNKGYLQYLFHKFKGVYYGDVHERLNFLEIQELKPLRACQKHVETMSEGCFQIFF